MAEPVLQAHFGLRAQDFSLRIRLELGQEMAVLFGPSGAGKSLCMRALAGLIRPQTGSIHLDGKALFDAQRGIMLPPQQRRIGYVPQNYALFPHMTVSENITYGLRGMKRAQRISRLEELLSIMRLEGLQDRRPSQLSGGQQQRVALARALARQPALLLMDEPFGALDESLREHLRQEILALQRQLRIPMLLVTHDVSEAYRLADRLIVLADGRVAQAGARDEVFRRPASLTVARLMGMSNILRGQVLRREGGRLVVQCQGLELLVEGDLPIAPGQRVTLGIRPEEVMISRKQPPLPAGRPNTLVGRVLEDRPLGQDHLITFAVETPLGETLKLQARLPHPIALKLGLAQGGQRLLGIEPQSLHVIGSGD
jgi:molybdate transport system ATP-binding protein